MCVCMGVCMCAGTSMCAHVCSCVHGYAFVHVCDMYVYLFTFNLKYFDEVKKKKNYTHL